MTPDESLAKLALPEVTTRRWAEQLAEPQRHYHIAAHIAHMLALLPAVAATREMIAAIWLHDVVYDPRAADNEEQSAAQAARDLAATDLDIATVTRLILATKGHAATQPDEAVLIDLDLAILAVEPAAYDAYAAQIRCEYTHVPDADYRAGRTAILRRFDATALYRTAPFTAGEAAAHANLRREIATLEHTA